ncbi:hypothetical protein STRCR_0038 [Streptococcus criceti HS-6]|uniref:Uncharacterized protein n=1 Tax=Streptococcus criceti HS-6 TaxID=873449 RepID=G5JMS4_STRCG|nr:hypothetical protein STRCR_0038 [Streptococcus criceti HS-6]
MKHNHQSSIINQKKLFWAPSSKFHLPGIFSDSSAGSLFFLWSA